MNATLWNTKHAVYTGSEESLESGNKLRCSYLYYCVQNEAQLQLPPPQIFSSFVKRRVLDHDDTRTSSWSLTIPQRNAA